MDNKKKEKSEGEKLAEKLLSDKKNGGLRLSEEKLKKADKFCEGYKSFLNTAKTEREAVIETVAQAEKAGFKPYEKGKKYDAGDKFYYVNRGKAIILTVMGLTRVSDLQPLISTRHVLTSSRTLSMRTRNFACSKRTITAA